MGPRNVGSRDMVHDARQAGYKMSAAVPRRGFAALGVNRELRGFRALGFGVWGLA